MKLIVRISVVSSLFLLTACHGSYYNIPGPEIEPTKYVSVGRAAESATGIMLFNIIPIQQTNKIQRAVASAIASKGGDAMTDIRIRERWYWAYILNIYSVDVDGEVLRLKTDNARNTTREQQLDAKTEETELNLRAPSTAESDEELVTWLNKLKTARDQGLITEEEYQAKKKERLKKF